MEVKKLKEKNQVNGGGNSDPVIIFTQSFPLGADKTDSSRDFCISV